MSDTAQRNRPGTPANDPSGDPAEQARKASVAKRGGGDPAGRGRTTIADGVVEKIAGLAARDVWASTPWAAGSPVRSARCGTGCPAAEVGRHARA